MCAADTEYALIIMAQDLNSGGASWASFLPRGCAERQGQK